MSDVNQKLLVALKELLIDMSIAQNNMRQAALYDAKWEGCAEAIQPRVDAARKAVEEAEKEQQTSSLGEKLGIVRTDSDFDFDRNSQTHTPKLTLYFEPVHVQAPYNSKGWNDRYTAATLLAAPERNS